MLTVAVVSLGLVASPKTMQPLVQAPRVQPVAMADAAKARASLMGALVGASACALAGAGLAEATTPSAFTLLSDSGAPAWRLNSCNDRNVVSVSTPTPALRSWLCSDAHRRSLTGRAGMFNQDVLFTDFLVQGFDAGNTAGYAVLALAVMIALASPDAWSSAADLAAEEVEACLIDYESEGPICGKGECSVRDNRAPRRARSQPHP